MPRGWTDDDPRKGTPHRRVREKIGLLLSDIGGEGEALEKVILRVADKRPEDVLDALIWLCEDDDEPVTEQQLEARLAGIAKLKKLVGKRKRADAAVLDDDDLDDPGPGPACSDDCPRLMTFRHDREHCFRPRNTV